jgi:hypothetical protein
VAHADDDRIGLILRGNRRLSVGGIGFSAWSYYIAEWASEPQRDVLTAYSWDGTTILRYFFLHRFKKVNHGLIFTATVSGSEILMTVILISTMVLVHANASS